MVKNLIVTVLDLMLIIYLYIFISLYLSIYLYTYVDSENVGLLTYRQMDALLNEMYQVHMVVMMDVIIDDDGCDNR